MEFTPSIYNLAIFEEVKFGSANVVIDAVPGSGKTTTILKSITYVEPGLSILVLAFNKSTKENAEKKIPVRTPTVRVQTFHGLGLQAISKSFLCPQGKYPTVDEKKCYNIITQMLNQKYMDLGQDQINAYKPIIKKIVTYCKALMPAKIDKETVEKLIDKYNIYSETLDPEINRLTEMVIEVIHQCKVQIGTIDYDDMIWYPLIYNLKLPYTYHVLFVDELQDLNPAQIQLLLKAVKLGGKIIAVGDSHQAIYAFRGADSEAMPNMIKAINAKVMPLWISYRCPKSHVARLKKYVPAIEAAPWAKEGSIKQITENQVTELIQENDMMICRYTAPLIPMAFQLIKAGKKAVVKGRDIGTNLISIINARKAKDIEDLIDKLKTWKENESRKAVQIGSNPETINDKFECIIALTQDCNDIECLKRKINTIFSDNVAPIILATIHRAKGLEAERIFILHPELMPSTYAKTAEEFRQEGNALYIANSRSMDTIFEVR